MVAVSIIFQESEYALLLFLFHKVVCGIRTIFRKQGAVCGNDGGQAGVQFVSSSLLFLWISLPCHIDANLSNEATRRLPLSNL